eukprot:TRINITY_DN6304_c0_g1_i1.p1 TRINITY_DN6304_c0_g1~~TRINITY_DN6304_c0_g1_i1.p1  ORF type:complete len:575 (-),score=108.71 TRINITY_DN6304_c0_g1_i1:1138-2724(-)
MSVPLPISDTSDSKQIWNKCLAFHTVNPEFLHIQVVDTHHDKMQKRLIGSSYVPITGLQKDNKITKICDLGDNAAVEIKLLAKYSDPPINKRFLINRKNDNRASIAEDGLIEFNANDIERDFPHLAKGSYGVVFTGIVPGFTEKVVIKDMEIRNNKSTEQWKKEIYIMNQNKSPYIVQVHGYCKLRNILTIVVEWVKRGSLYDVLHVKKYHLSMLQRIRMARHCSLGIAELHKNMVIHRDVKSMNILVTENFACKLTDFGCAKSIYGNEMYNTMNSGTPLWMAPEVQYGQYSFEADVYSLGIVLFELFEKQLPRYDRIRRMVVLPRTFQSSNVILPCLNYNCNLRPKVVEVISVLDDLIAGIVTSIRKLLPDREQEIIVDIMEELNTGKRDSLDDELVALYRHLLGRDPNEVDQMIDSAYRSDVNSGYEIPGTMIDIHGSYNNVYNATNSYYQHSNHLQPLRNEPPPKDELTLYLEMLSLYELQSILHENNIDYQHISNDKHQLIGLIRSNCADKINLGPSNTGWNYR